MDINHCLPRTLEIAVTAEQCQIVLKFEKMLKILFQELLILFSLRRKKLLKRIINRMKIKQNSFKQLFFFV